MSSSSGSGDTAALEADAFIKDGSIQFRKLFGTILGAFVALAFGAWIEALSTIVSLHVWVIDSFGRFLEALVSSAFGAGAAAQTAAWSTAAERLAADPFLAPFVIALEAFVLYAAIRALRTREVIP